MKVSEFVNFKIKVRFNAPQQANRYDCKLYVIKFMEGSGRVVDVGRLMSSNFVSMMIMISIA